MNGTTARHMALVLLICVSLIGCSKADLTLKLKPGDKRVIEVTNNLTITSTIEGEEDKETMSGIQRYTYEVQSVDSQGVATVRVTTDLKEMARDTGMFDSAESAADFSRTIGEVSPTIQLAPDGTVLSVTGMEQYANKAADAVKKSFNDDLAEDMAKEGLPPQGMMADPSVDTIADQMGGIVKKYMSNEAMKNQLQPFTAACHAEPVGVGSTWTRENFMVLPFPGKITATYRVARRGGGLTNFEYKSDVSTDPSGDIDMGVMKYRIALSGSQSGTIQVDEASGWLTESSIDCNIEGTWEMGEGPEPFKVEGNVYTRTYAQ